MLEFGAALQLFAGFGENWHALGECLSYLDEWLPGSDYFLVFEDAHMILADETEDIQWLVATFNEVFLWWSKPIVDNDRFNRNACPFRVILESQAQSDFELISAIHGSGQAITAWP